MFARQAPWVGRSVEGPWAWKGPFLPLPLPSPCCQGYRVPTHVMLTVVLVFFLFEPKVIRASWAWTSAAEKIFRLNEGREAAVPRVASDQGRGRQVHGVGVGCKSARKVTGASVV